jgi:hypothetical protein
MYIRKLNLFGNAKLVLEFIAAKFRSPLAFKHVMKEKSYGQQKILFRVIFGLSSDFGM